MSDVFSDLPAHERRRLEAVATGRELEALIARRSAGEPLQYLEGSAAFLDFEVVVDERVLIPRPETEGLFEMALRHASDPGVVVDLGTGSGVLAIGAARHFPGATVHAVDVSPVALELARANARRNSVDVTFHEGDLFDALPVELRGQIDLVLSNPPYVATEDLAALPADVRREPVIALDGGVDGFAALRRIAETAEGWLAPGAKILCEIGETHSRLAADTFRPLGAVSVHRDLTDRVRYVKVET